MTADNSAPSNDQDIDLTKEIQDLEQRLIALAPLLNKEGGHVDLTKDLLNVQKQLIGLIPFLNKKTSAKPDSTGFFKSLVENYERKRLFVCCDGTWQNASGTIAPLTNVAKLARCVDRVGREVLSLPHLYPSETTTDSCLNETTDREVTGRFGIVRQVVYYSSGVGTQSSISMDRKFAAITGTGVSANILSAYCFISNNYNFLSNQDQIILVGFSRGAFTVRCLANLISKIGLLRRKGLPFLSVLFNLWRQGRNSELEIISDALGTLREKDVRIKVLAEWDTVSAMGSPLGFWKNELSSVSTLDEVPKAVDNAFLAFALDEKRPKFKPMLWKRKEGSTNVKQCAFLGCHSDIGGGEPDPGLSTVSLLWMISKIKEVCNAEFDNGALLQFFTPFQPHRWNNSDEGRSLFLRLRNLLPRGEKKMRLKDLSSTRGYPHESLVGWWLISHYLSLTLWSGKRTKLLVWNNDQDDLAPKIHFTVRVLENRKSPVECWLFNAYSLVPGPPAKWKIKRGNHMGLSEDAMNRYEKCLLQDWAHVSNQNGSNSDGNIDWSEIAKDLNWEKESGCDDNSLIHLIEKELANFH